jgi:hypothetical protein
MIRLAALALLVILALPPVALAGEPATPVAAQPPVAKSEVEAKREPPIWAMPHRKAEHRRHFSRDLDPRFRELLSVPTLTR